jgi:hypothetical protein
MGPSQLLASIKASNTQAWLKPRVPFIDTGHLGACSALRLDKTVPTLPPRSTTL